MSAQPELVPQTPVYIGGRLFNPASCVHGEDYSGDANGEHHCAHDWRIYWGNQNRPTT
ncbi:hypothetical protein JF714_14395 [Mycobacterium avium]|uniref:hypothetical protein n=1 Tax=Mycobacterium avium TaxID=1764 RepID=UPI001CDACFF8|nr:hypothetical protein [Mycobacterium avium]MCA2331633.1 hypothetical protein [Mycobacterium avium]